MENVRKIIHKHLSILKWSALKSGRRHKCICTHGLYLILMLRGFLVYKECDQSTENRALCETGDGHNINFLNV